MVLLGGTSEIGLAIVDQLISGALQRIVLACRNTESGERAVAQIRAKHPSITVEVVAFDGADTLWLLNGNGNLYTIDPATAAPTLRGSVPGLPNGYAHHGSINPANGLLYALGAKDSDPAPQILAIDLAARTVVGAAPTD
ncbi:MAG TPA: hypothetical protein PKV27_08935, partial [Ilumatobacteraceae bacterium]|nr:hypothetical protein [Ilumatobacteraceae bacterium]